jgi:hypothetical protein
MIKQTQQFCGCLSQQQLLAGRTVHWVDGHLHIAASALHAHLPDNGQGSIPEPLVLLVSQGLGRGHRDGVTWGPAAAAAAAAAGRQSITQLPLLAS